VWPMTSITATVSAETDNNVSNGVMVWGPG
jgi:hypothetical protein